MMGAALLLGTTSCSDFLDQTSPSEVDKDFVLSGETSLRATLNDIYSNWRSYGLSHGNGTFYNMIVSSSDTELQPEAYNSQINRWLMSYFWGWQNDGMDDANWGTENVNPDGNGSFDSTWNNFYDLIGKCNAIIKYFEDRADFNDLMSGSATSLTQLYGEAVAMRATCYFELIRHYGDCAFLTVQGEEPDGLTNRDYIAEYILNDLKRAIPVMFYANQASINKSMFNRTYAEGLVGRICLWMGGYQTRRSDLGDDFYKLADGTTVAFTKVSENGSRKCFYGRRNDWRSLYEIAEKYLGDAYDSHAGVVFQNTDPRSGDRHYDNPYQ